MSPRYIKLLHTEILRIQIKKYGSKSIKHNLLFTYLILIRTPVRVYQDQL